MPGKKAPIVITSTRRYKLELENLYARRSAIEAVIESLEEYGKYRTRRLTERKRKTA